MDDTFRQNVLNDLEKSGFGSEMRALQVFQSCGWRMVGTDIYHDEDEDRFREIDVSAFQQRWLSVGTKTVAALFGFVVAEVKKSEKPWVVFKPTGSSHFVGAATYDKLVYGTNLPCSLSELRRVLVEDSLVGRAGWVATGIHESFKKPSQRSTWYEAVLQACKGAEYVMNREASGEGLRGERSGDLLNQATYLSVF